MTEEGKSAETKLAPRAEITAYSTAFFSIGMLPMFHVVGPLWALKIGADPFTIGVAMGSRSALPFLFALFLNKSSLGLAIFTAWYAIFPPLVTLVLGWLLYRGEKSWIVFAGRVWVSIGLWFGMQALLLALV